MKIENMLIKDIKPYERNAKKHDKNIIEFVNNILINWKKQQLRFSEMEELNEFDFSVLS